MEDIKSCIELSEKNSSGMEIAQDLAREGKINPKALDLITDEAMCETFGWLPEQLENIEIFYYDLFSTIISHREGIRSRKIEEAQNKLHR